MGLPKFPKLPMPPPREVLLSLLLQTVVLEEQALAALLNAEAEKVQEMVQTGLATPITAAEAVEINRSVAEVVRAIVEKEERLLRKIQLVTNAAPRKRLCATSETED